MHCAGHGVSSHSMRKSLASMAIAAGCPTKRVMALGVWSSEKAMEPYVNKQFAISDWGRKLVDFLM